MLRIGAVVHETATFLFLLSVQPLSGIVSPFAEMVETDAKMMGRGGLGGDISSLLIFSMGRVHSEWGKRLAALNDNLCFACGKVSGWWIQPLVAAGQVNCQPTIAT